MATRRHPRWWAHAHGWWPCWSHGCCATRRLICTWEGVFNHHRQGGIDHRSYPSDVQALGQWIRVLAAWWVGPSWVQQLRREG